MSNECADIHRLSQTLERHSFPFNEIKIPLNGIYILFQKGESAHSQDRIVRVGTHTGKDRLRLRLKEHFLTENKDRSIFRKNIGGALLNKKNNPFLKFWDIDLTTRKSREKHSSLIDFDYQNKVELEVSKYIKDNFSFIAFEVEDKKIRLEIETGIISTVSWCKECMPSNKWLGNHSPKKKIVESGLWLVNKLYKTPFNLSYINEFKELIKC